MARNDILIDAPPRDVYETLMDTSAYARWVVGARDIRAADRSWPKPGSRFHHRVGIGPLTLRDNTKLIEAEPDRKVVLEVRARPLGRARVQLDLRPKAKGRRTKVVMTEHTTGGIWSVIPNPVENGLVYLRNRASLHRLRKVVVGHHHVEGKSHSGE
ncbi:MAG TPA: SRPBCC family protein [Acidimicrobiia bacterium]|jgi:uncharacterized protein YndB with AHSA1/START domain